MVALLVLNLCLNQANQGHNYFKQRSTARRFLCWRIHVYWSTELCKHSCSDARQPQRLRQLDGASHHHETRGAISTARQAGHKKHTQREGEPSLHQPFQNTAAWRFFSLPRSGSWVNTIASHCKSYTELFSEIALNRLKQPAYKNPQLIKFLLKSAMLYDDSHPSFVFPFMLVTYYFFTNYFFTIIILQ